uniref:peptidylglycine monooxygenase n=1 Tax=Dugesia japonica TaxID=6161 RepID=Q4W7B5_DUGJA|nr:peptidylglycine a-hydroxylating monooxygenase [Dugesia japonica]
MFVFLLICFSISVEAEELLLKMPGVKPTKEDEYICHAMDLKNETVFITGFQPKANASHAHHILIHSCVEPGSIKSFWNCLEMKIKDTRPVCKSGEKLIYSWAMNASGFRLPKDVSIMIGKSIGKQYLVIQSHYKHVDYFREPNSEPDESGIILKIQHKPTKKLAGLYLLATDGSIPGHSTVFMEAACSYTGGIVLHPFAYRVHTHSLGKLVSGYVVHRKNWTEIGKKSPQEEQMFYPVKGNVIIQPGDSLAARCVMENKGDKLVRIGSTRNDEMCNFYIYYWVNRADSAQIYDDKNQICFTQGWPDYKWDNFIDPSKIPVTAAMLPGSNEAFKEMINNMNNDEKEMDKLMSDELNEIYDDFDNSFIDLPNHKKFENVEDEFF